MIFRLNNEIKLSIMCVYFNLHFDRYVNIHLVRLVQIETLACIGIHKGKIKGHVHEYIDKQ